MSDHGTRKPNPAVGKNNLPLPKDESWESLEPYLEFLLKLPERGVRSFLETLSEDQPAFAKKLESLLRSDDENQGVLHKPLLQQLQLPEQKPEALPEKFGDYRVLKKLGSGGMGQVFQAEATTSECSEKVAIKVLRGEKSSVLHRQLFLREAAILAKLDHPNIASLRDSGVTDAGQPYLVMAFIDGIPMDAYFQTRQTSVRHLLDVFLKVCDAVAYAHQHMIVHRDLKPANILITPEGEPCLLDFGVGKILQESGETPAADTSTRMLTPQYASPEQMFGKPVTLRTDVFSLGVLLYELLTLKKPYHLPSNPSVLELAALFDKAPEKPSALWKKRFQAVQGRRQRKAFPKGLDFVVLRAIRREPEKRFASVVHFAEALRQVQDGGAAGGSRENFSYLAGRLLKRHPLVTCGFLVSVLVLGILTVRLYQEKRVAQTQNERAEKIAFFLSSVFDIKNIHDEKGDQIPAKLLLDHAVLEMEANGEAQQDISEELWAKVGDLYAKLGLNENAEAALLKSLEVATPGNLKVQRPYRLIELGNVKYARGQLEEAGNYFRLAKQAAGDVDQLQGDYPALYYLGCAMVHADRWEYDRADAHFDKAMASLGPDSKFQGTRLLIFTSLGSYKSRLGAMDEAEMYLKRAESLAQHIYGKHHPRLALAYNNLGSFYSKRESYDKAASYFSKSLAISEKVYGHRSPQVFNALNNQAIVLKKTGQLDKAEASYLRCEDIGLHHYGENSPRMATLWSNLAVLKNHQKKFAEADAYYQRILACDLDPSTMALFHKNYGDNLFDMGKFDEAEAQLRHALKHYEAAHGERNMQVASLNLGIGKCLYQRAEYRRAKVLFARSMGIIAALYPPDHLYVASTYMRMGQVSGRLGELEDCIDYFEKALAIRKAKWGDRSPKLKTTLLAYSKAAERLGQLDKKREIEAQMTNLEAVN